MNTSPLISRLAPTPSGFLHRGNALNFILTWVMTKAHNGILHLRIDDYDAPRCKESYVENIFHVLEYLNLDWDEGPCSVQSFYKEYSLRTKIEHYRSKLQDLRETTSLTYACECSRKTIEQGSTNGLYAFTCKDKHLSLRTNHTALRLHVSANTNIHIEQKTIALDKVLGDFILWRRDDLPSYQLGSLLDDATIGTNLLVRGEDLLESSAAQLYLASLLHVKSFQRAMFYHHPLVLDDAGHKLSKTHQAKKLDLHLSPITLYQEAASLLGLDEKIETLEELLECYKISLMNGAGSAK